MTLKSKLLCLTVVALTIAALPSMAFGVLVNEYGMVFAGQSKCLECHDGTYALTVHGRFAKTGLVPDAPAGWTSFKAAGDLTPVGDVNDLTGLPWYSEAGIYPVSLPWITLGDFEGGAATEYIFFSGNTSGTKANPWNLVEGLIAEPTGEWLVGSEDPEKGLYDVVYGCQRCHMLGTTNATTSTADLSAVPNPTVSRPATDGTKVQWARDEVKTAADFNEDYTVAEAGMSIQCEACHGTGFRSESLTTKHWNSGTQLSHRVPNGTAAPGGTLAGTTVSTLGDSQVCGQCHGSYTTVPGTLGIYGYTPNLKMRDFVNINGATGGTTYTYTPTEAEFLANPTKYYLFPNGSNAKGNHYYYNEWSTSAHAYRGAWFSPTTTDTAHPTGKSIDPDALEGGKSGHYNAKTSGLDCARCHTGEGYLDSKDAIVNVGYNNPFVPTTSTVGFMGQECITCHNPHPAAVGDASNIRQPDAAGVRSNAANAAIAAAGLPANTTANATMCEDCHNWQLEVQGTSPTIKPLASLSSRGGPSHPQRETLHGRVMLEVPAAGEFMPGAECQECHMPKTNKNANRYSHGMHIMLPGKAAEWNAAAGAAYRGEDSCSGCHAGETRAELQANIDEWQNQVAAASADASAAIVGAVARADAEFSLSDSSKPGYILAGRATWNYKAVGSDGSGGAHNPEYVVDGLEVATKMAKSVGGSFNQLYATSRINYGGLAIIGANLKNGDGTNAVGATVALEKLVGSTWTQQGDAVTTNVNGNASFLMAPTAIGDYRLRWDRSSINSTDLYSAVKRVTVVSITTAARSRSSVYLGRTFVLSGSVTPNASGAAVRIQAKKGSGSYRTIYTNYLSAGSTYARTIKPGSRGTWYYRVVYAGNAAVAGSTSPSVKVYCR